MGRDENNAVGTTNTENRCRGSVFQNREILYFIRVDLRKFAFHTVDQHQRCRIIAVQRTNTADIDRCGVVTRLSGGLYGRHAGNRTGQYIGNACDGRLDQFLGIDRCQSSGNRRLGLRAVADDNHIVEPCGILFQRNIELRTGRNRRLNGLITQIRESQNSFGALHVDGVETIGVGSGSVRRSLLDDGDTDQHIAAGIPDRSPNSNLTERRIGRRRLRCLFPRIQDDLPFGNPEFGLLIQDSAKYCFQRGVTDIEAYFPFKIHRLVLVQKNITFVRFDLFEHLFQRFVFHTQRDTRILSQKSAACPQTEGQAQQTSLFQNMGS